MKFIVTGAAGFIGFHLSKRLIEENNSVVGIDNINSYYDINLKESRIKKLNEISLNKKSIFDLFKINIEDKFKLNEIFSSHKPDYVINLALKLG